MGWHIGLPYVSPKHTPAQLIFGCNIVINQCHDVDWEAIRKQKQDLINRGNKSENCDKKIMRTTKETLSYLKMRGK